MIHYHYFVELALWMAGFYVAGCPLGALARGLWDRLRNPVSEAS